MTFQKGKSGNPRGRAKRTAKESAQARHDAVLRRLEKMSRTAKSEIARVTAGVKFLEFSAGKPSASRNPLDAEAEAMRAAAEMERMGDVEVARRIARILLSAVPQDDDQRLHADLATTPPDSPPYVPPTLGSPTQPEPAKAHHGPTGEAAEARPLSVLREPDMPSAPVGTIYAGTPAEQGWDAGRPRVIHRRPHHR